jgi:hypothetical protein
MKGYRHIYIPVQPQPGLGLALSMVGPGGGGGGSSGGPLFMGLARWVCMRGYRHIYIPVQPQPGLGLALSMVRLYYACPGLAATKFYTNSPYNPTHPSTNSFLIICYPTSPLRSSPSASTFSFLSLSPYPSYSPTACPYSTNTATLASYLSLHFHYLLSPTSTPFPNHHTPHI